MGTSGFVNSNRSNYTLERNSGSRWRHPRRGISFCEIGNVFACSSASRGAMVNLRPRFYSAQQICLKPALHAVLILGGNAVRGGEKALGGIFDPGKLWMFLLVPQQPVVLLTNGWHRRIQHINLV